MQRMQLNWTVGFSRDPAVAPETRVPAAVPGAVQLDWAKAQGWGLHYFAENWKDYRWMEDVWWSYATKLNPPALAANQRLYFVCKGVDYQFAIKLNNETLHEQEGMYTPVEIDLTGRVKKGDELQVLVHPVPKSNDGPEDREQANQCCKPAVAYTWDFHPRLIPSGIWDETFLEVRPALHLKSAETLYTLNDDLSRAQVAVNITATDKGRVRWRLSDRGGKPVFEREYDLNNMAGSWTESVDHPELWWPNGQGEPVLYTSSVELLDSAGQVTDCRQSRIGFRRVKLVMAPGQWKWPSEFPKGPSNPPITLQINNRSIFAKGSNWVAPDIFPGTISVDTYRGQLDMVKAAHMNILRLWGGAIINKDVFYDLCDERGIMVWQEFPLSCIRYEGTSHYLKVLDQESRSILLRLRHRTCIVLWCAGNELFNSWAGMTEQDLPIRLLDRNSFDLDPNRPFMKTSPIMGMGHGHYAPRDPLSGVEPWSLFQNSQCTAYTEFGCGGPSDVDTIKHIIPPEDLFPPLPGTAWESHHAFKAWMAESHLYLSIIDDYFGPSCSLEELVEKGQLLQAQIYKGLFEEARRQKPQASMALNWCFNEPWPCAANNSILAWPAVPKQAYHAIAESLRNVLASAKISKFRWTEGEMFDPELWMLNDDPHPLPAGRIEAFLKVGDEEIFLLGWDHPGAAANTNLPGPVIRFKLPHASTTRMHLILRGGDGRYDSEYTLPYVPSEKRAEQTGARALNQ